ncbi:LLM class F420-dependent oxidoreductase [Gordonia sp. VNQ95]|uniref:LLM class F420-dependent oxidoreductase n=1 Tax=Gordonia sp. VNQ95 TaxID=3156619 RepID=UPI0032B47F94
MELALHIADFTWDSGPSALGPTLAQHVRDAEDIGVRRISVMDHFWQIRGVGPAENEMLEAYSALGFIAAHTEHSLLHTLVTGVTYRESALLAKAVTTLDVLSGGRAGLGIGAAWNDEESEGLGFDFPPTSERFERLEETIRICLQMWSDSEEPFEGKYYTLARTLNSPQSLSRPRPYLMIGGSGEKKTLRMVAQYADACNIFGGPDAGHKLDVLRAHCDTVGRDYDEIDKTTIFSINPDSTVDDIVETANEMAGHGFTSAYVYATGITEPRRIIDLFAGAMPRLV